MRLTRACLLLALAACSDEERERSQRSEYVDEGAVCLRSEPTGELSVQTLIDACGSGCARVVASTCQVVADGNDLIVHSFVAVERTIGRNIECPTVCVPIGTSCTPTAIPPGDYTLRHGTHSMPVRLPTEQRLVPSSDAQLPGGWCR